MKKKLSLVLGSLIVLGSLFVGYTLTMADENLSGQQKDVKNKSKLIQENIPEKIEGKDGRSLYSIKSYQVERTEFTELEDFVQNQFKNWQQNSELSLKMEQGDKVYTLANSALAYINYFEKDIEDKRMTEEFKNWQLTAYEIKNNFGIANSEAKLEELAQKYELQLNQIYTKF